MTTCPFPLPAALLEKLPPASRDENHYLDVRVGGKWDGVVVANSKGMCIGVYIHRRIEQHPLPFAGGDIEDVRKASLCNRILAAIPFDLWDVAVLTIVVVSPMALMLAWLLWLPFALISILACAVAIRIMYLVPGFPFIRLPIAILGMGQIVYGGIFLIRSVL